MKKAPSLLLALVLMALQAAGQQKQVPEEALLIALKDGSVIYPEAIKPKALPLLKPYLRVDSQYRLIPEEIKYYKDGSSYFFWAEVSESGEGELLRLDARGKVTTYFSNHVVTKPVSPHGNSGLAGKPDYFQAGNSAIRKISYQNLRTALPDNSESMQKLQEVKRLRKTNKICLVAGGSMLAAGLVHSRLLNRNPDNPPMIETGLKTRISPLVLLGALTLTVPLANRVPAESKLGEAIAIYNK